MPSITVECRHGAVIPVQLPQESMDYPITIEPCHGCSHLAHGIISVLLSQENNGQVPPPYIRDHRVSVTLNSKETPVVDQCECHCRPGKNRS